MIHVKKCFNFNNLKHKIVQIIKRLWYLFEKASTS